MITEAIAALNQGKYLLGPVISEGIFSRTYRGTQTESAREVIIKTITPSLQEHPNFEQFRQQFLRLAKKLQTCQHPNLVKVTDSFVEDGLPYLVCEYLKGKTLAAVINSGFLPHPEKATKYILQVSKALAVLHNAGLPHRHIKPDNILITQNQTQAVLIDVSLISEFTPGIKATHANLVFPEYAAPEQYNPNLKATPATDIYSLAATFYCLLTGNPPPPAPLQKRIPPTAWRKFDPNLNSEVKTAILSGLNLEREKRPQSVKAWLALLPPQELSPPETRNYRPSVKEIKPQPPKIHQKTVEEKKISPLRHSTLSKPSISTAPPLSLDSSPNHRLKSVAVTTPAQQPQPKPQPTQQQIAVADLEADLEVESVASQENLTPTAPPKFPWRLLLTICTISAAAGVGFGIVLRLNQPQEPGSSILHQQQSFPPLPDMPGEHNQEQE